MATAKVMVNGVWVPYLSGSGQAPIRLPHTFTIGGTVAVASGDVDYVPPFFVSVASGRSANIVGVRYRLNSGVSATFKIQVNGADATGYTGLSATTAPTSTTSGPIFLSDLDMVQLVVTAVSGSPKNMSVSVFVEYS